MIEWDNQPERNPNHDHLHHHHQLTPTTESTRTVEHLKNLTIAAAALMVATLIILVTSIQMARTWETPLAGIITALALTWATVAFSQHLTKQAEQHTQASTPHNGKRYHD